MSILQDKSGKISLAELREVCIQFNLPVEPELLESMFAYCDVDGDGQINYDEFANFLNWKDKMPSGGIKGTLTTTHETAEEEVKVRNKSLKKGINCADVVLFILLFQKISILSPNR